MNSWKNVVCIVMVVILALAGGFAGGIAADKLIGNTGIEFIDQLADEEEIEISTPSNGIIHITPSDSVTTAEAIAAKVIPSVVGISTTATQTAQTINPFDIFGFGGGFGGYSYDATAIGTGVIVDEAGYILTNSHVVNDGNAKSIMVSLYDGSEVNGAVLWSDSSIDLAVVKVEAKGLVAAELGDSDTVNIGAYAAAIGNPLGLQFERSISQGIISGLNRTITVSDESNGSQSIMEGLIQTDATINSGNSGGPLLNAKGEVVGINSAKASNGEGMGFAIPINVARPIVKQIKETGSFTRAYLGIKGIGLEEQSQYSDVQLKEYFGTSTGIYVQSVTENGGADGAGIKAGDIIVTVDGQSVSTMNRINAILVSKSVGDEVEVEYMHEGRLKKTTVILTPAIIVIE